MTEFIFCTAAIIFFCVIAEKFSDKFGMPALILFMFVGIMFGSDGIFGIPFEDFALAEKLCSIALIFIMFYGGFNTKWETAKQVAGKAVLLSTVGVFVTAAITTVLCYYFLHMPFAESFLIGAVLSSTDAASVFAILRKNKLNLKDGTASILEVESGSNDPVAYLLTVIAINMVLTGEMGSVIVPIILQLAIGVAVGLIFAKGCVYIVTRTGLVSDGLDTVYFIAAVLICYAVTDLLGGNAYLSVYLFGIYTGNRRIKNKQTIIAFFDGLTSLSQILIFFLIGLLSFPHQMPKIMGTAVFIVVILTLIARPIATFLLIKPLKCSTNQCLLIAWAGLRGASSSVFAIMAVAAGVSMRQDLFHIVFMVSLFSVALQGTLLPKAAKLFDMIDDNSDVRKTFNDYQDVTDFKLVRMHINPGHIWENSFIRDVSMPTGTLAIMIKRGKQTIVTKGDTQILNGDDLIISVPPYHPGKHEKLREIEIGKNDAWCNKEIKELKVPKNELITMVIRGEDTIIPDGSTKILENDVVVVYQAEMA